jgi:hypothetical protein
MIATWLAGKASGLIIFCIACLSIVLLPVSPVARVMRASRKSSKTMAWVRGEGMPGLHAP